MTQTDVGSPATDSEQARLRRSTDDKIFAGVCGGLGRYFNTDPLWFRLGFVAVTLAGGAGILFYLIAWITMPQQDPGEVLVSKRDKDDSQLPILGGVVLVAIGIVLLANNFIPWVSELMWPMALVAAGLGLIYVGRIR